MRKIQLLDKQKILDQIEKMQKQIEDAREIACRHTSSALAKLVRRSIADMSFYAGGEYETSGPFPSEPVHPGVGRGSHISTKPMKMWLPLLASRQGQRIRLFQERSKKLTKSQLAQLASKPMLIASGKLHSSIDYWKDFEDDHRTIYKAGVYGLGSKGMTIALVMEMGNSWGEIKWGKGGRHRLTPPRSYLLNTINQYTGFLYEMMISAFKSRIEVK